MRKIKKTAGIYGDYVSDTLYSFPVAQTAGLAHGLLTSDDETDASLAQANRNGALSVLPGVGTSRVIRKQLHSAKKGKHPATNVLGEKLGDYTSAALLGLLGAGAGAFIARKYGKELFGEELKGWDADRNAIYAPYTALKYALMGAGAGAAVGGGAGVLGNMAGRIAALIKQRRTDAEQKEHDQSRNIANWLIPGVGAYNYYKRLGNIHARELEQDRQDIIKGLV